MSKHTFCSQIKQIKNDKSRDQQDIITVAENHAMYTNRYILLFSSHNVQTVIWFWCCQILSGYVL